MTLMDSGEAPFVVAVSPLSRNISASNSYVRYKTGEMIYSKAAFRKQAPCEGMKRQFMATNSDLDVVPTAWIPTTYGSLT